jgi:Family of unknown function (DUF5762)
MNNTTNNNNINIPFWGESPLVLLDLKYIGEIFPNAKQTTPQKYNSLTRLIIFITIIIFIITFSLSLLVMSIITIFGIYLYYYQYVAATEENKAVKEGFTSPTQIVSDMMAKNGITELPPKGIFDEGTTVNPFSNVLLTDYNFNPNKRPAEPAFNENIIDNINKNTKKMVQELNPTISNLESKLYKGLGDQLAFEQSQQRFVSNPSTTIPNNDKAFKDFCYGSMISCKEGNPFACAKNLSRYQH